MTKPKNKTLIERIGFDDKDMLTANHDEILIKLLDPGNKIKIMRHFFPELQKIISLSQLRFCVSSEEDREEVLKSVRYSIKEHDIGISELLHFILWSKSHALSEVPIKSNNYLIGFLDLRYTIDLAEVSRDGKGVDEALKKYNGHLVFSFERLSNEIMINRHKTIDIEVKTEIKNFGETLRQINTYKSYSNPDNIFVLICPDDKFKEAFRSQKIILLTYEDINKICNGEKKE